MTVSETINEMSAGACEVLAGMPGARIGQVPPRLETLAGELAELGVIGENGGLTIKGSAVAKILQDQYLDRMFG